MYSCMLDMQEIGEASLHMRILLTGCTSYDALTVTNTISEPSRADSRSSLLSVAAFCRKVWQMH